MSGASSTLPRDLPLRSPEEAARRIALSFLDEARAAADRLGRPDDVEALHDFRVGIRRLRSTVRAWKGALRGAVGRKRREALRALQSATGGGRDAEVALAWLEGQRAGLKPVHRPGHRWLRDRLSGRLESSMGHVAERVLEEFAAIESDLRQRLGTLEVEVRLDEDPARSTFADALAKKAREHAEDLVQQLARVVGFEDRAQAHQARIRGKRLRYLLEPVRDWVPEATRVVKLTKKLQDLLGDLNDAHVLDDELKAALEASAVEQARRLHEIVGVEGEEALRRKARQNERSGLLELARRGRRRARRLFSRLERDWLTTAAAPLVAQVEEVARRLEALPRSGREIERKLLLDQLPSLPEDAEIHEIEQGWLPGKTLQERLRRTNGPDGERLLRTVKLGEGLVRTEIEEETCPELFAAMWPLTEGRRVLKRRWRVFDGSHTWEVDAFQDRELFLAEVELRDPGESVEPPPWLAPHVVKDVTGDPAYVNVNLAR